MGKYIKNNEGAALIMVLITLVVLSILLTSLIGTTMANANHAIKWEKNKQADYIAKTGAEAGAKYIIENREETEVVNLYNSTTSKNIISEDIINGDVAVSVQGSNEDKNILFLSSTGTVGNETETVNIVMKKNIAAPWFGKHGINSKTKALGGGGGYDVYANVAAGEGSAGDIDVEDGYKYLYGDSLPENFVETFPTVDFWRDKGGNIINEGSVYDYGQINGNIGNVKLKSSDYSGKIIINGINLKGNATLDFYTKDVFYVKINGNLEGRGTTAIKTSGTGEVHMFVDGNINFGGTFDSDLSGDADSLVIYVPSGNNITLKGTPVKDAHIIAPDVNITMSGNPTITGMVIVNKFSGNGSFTFNQFPDFNNDMFEGTIGWPLQIIEYTKE